MRHTLVVQAKPKCPPHPPTVCWYDVYADISFDAKCNTRSKVILQHIFVRFSKSCVKKLARNISIKPISIHSDPLALPVLTETSDYSYLSVKIWQVLLTRSSFSGREQKDNKLRALNHSPTPIMVYRILLNYGSTMLNFFIIFELSAGLKWLAILATCD